MLGLLPPTPHNGLSSPQLLVHVLESVNMPGHQPKYGVQEKVILFQYGVTMWYQIIGIFSRESSVPTFPVVSDTTSGPFHPIRPLGRSVLTTSNGCSSNPHGMDMHSARSSLGCSLNLLAGQTGPHTIFCVFVFVHVARFC